MSQKSKHIARGEETVFAIVDTDGVRRNITCDLTTGSSFKDVVEKLVRNTPKITIDATYIPNRAMRSAYVDMAFELPICDLCGRKVDRVDVLELPDAWEFVAHCHDASETVRIPRAMFAWRSSQPTPKIEIGRAFVRKRVTE